MRERDKRYLLFIASAVLLSIEVSWILGIGTVSNFIEITAMLVFSLFIASSFVYVFSFSSDTVRSARERDGAFASLPIVRPTFFLSAILVLMLAVLVSQSYALHQLNFSMPIVQALMDYTVVFVLFLLSFSLVAIGVRIGSAKHVRNGAAISYSFLAAAVLVVILFFSLGAVHYVLNDETFIGIQSFEVLVSGGNPYATSISQQVYNAYTSKIITAPTVTSNNSIVGSLEYPLLYILSLPFYYLFNIHTVEHFLLPIEIGVFAALILASLFKSIEPRRDSVLIYGLALVVPFMINTLTSPTLVLLFVLLVILFWKSESRYAGVLFGIAASLQQLAWIPLLLLFVYILNNNGSRRAATVLLTAAVTFLLINAYPIMLNSGAFFSSVLAPAGGSIIPTGGLFGYYMLASGVPEHVVTKVYFAAIAVSVVIMLFTNKKRLLGPLSLLSFMFLDHGLAVYFTLFVTLTVATMLIGNDSSDERANRFMVFLRSRGETVPPLSLALVALLVVVFSFYVAAPRPVPFYFYNASIGGPMNSTYSVSVAAGSGSANETFHVLLEAMMLKSYRVSSFGLFGSGVLSVNGAPSLQPNYTFSTGDINDNMLALRNTSTVRISIKAENLSAARCMIYSASGFILCPVAVSRAD